MKNRSITLELLRHGPANNQLLSRTTPYLALCESHGAQTINLPIDHAEYQIRLEGLRYMQSNPVIQGAALREATRDVTRVLSAIPAFAGELTAAQDADLIHIRLVLSASELSLLPFELAESPPGTPGEGQRLFLAASPPVVLTRETRREQRVCVPWPYRPRILFAFASPGPLAPVPVDAHLLALRRALDPWIGWIEGHALTEVGLHLTVLPNASLDAIADACRAAARDRRGPYTHVHVLAHGVAQPALGSREPRFYLALHAGRGNDAPDYVDGYRLEAALRPLPVCRDTLAVVSIASCDAGNPGSLVAGGASVAHELHEAGVPFVVASQFPLTFRGSTILVDRLYAELLRGTDPRRAAHEVRRELYAASTAVHDWASLVAYATLPTDIDAQLETVRYHRTRKAGDVAIARVHNAAVKHEGDMMGGAPPATGEARIDPAIEAESRALDTAFRDMELIIAELPRLAARAHGWLGSAAVRWAEMLLKVDPTVLVPGEHRVEGEGIEGTRLSRMDADDALRFAARHYLAAFVGDRCGPLGASAINTWGLVQWMTLTWVLARLDGDIQATVDEEAWTTAEWLTRHALGSCDEVRQAGVHDDRAQLYLLSMALPSRRTKEEVLRKIRAEIDALLGLVGPQSFQAFATYRQMRRFNEWWGDKDIDKDMKEVAGEMVKLLGERGAAYRWYER